MQIHTIVHLSLNTIIYGFICIMILKKKEFTPISIRSSILLLSNNFLSFLATTSIIFHNDNDLKEYYNTFFLLFFIFQSSMMVSFFLRSQKVIECCRIRLDEKNDVQRFYKKRYLFQEPFYVKILFISMIGLSLIWTLIIKILKYDRDYIFTIFIFIELLILVTYSYKILKSYVGEAIHLEIILFLFSWFISWNLGSFFSNNLILILFVSMYSSLIINGFIPLYMIKKNQKSFAFKYNSKLMNNLYLFLLNEETYHVFLKYIKTFNKKEISYLVIYTEIMKYKYDFDLEEDNETLINEAQYIFNTYFSNETYKDKFSDNVLSTIRERGNNLNEVENKKDMFDEVLIVCYEELLRIFEEFKKTTHFQILGDKIHFNDYIHCKMSNIGMINRY